MSRGDSHTPPPTIQASIFSSIINAIRRPYRLPFPKFITFRVVSLGRIGLKEASGRGGAKRMFPVAAVALQLHAK